MLDRQRKRYLGARDRQRKRCLQDTGADCWRKGKLADDPMKAHDELFVPMAEVPRRALFFGTPVPSCAEGWLEDVTGALERARDRDEALVLYAHDITADDAKKDPHNITRGQLDAILSRAAALDIPVIGFDELASPSN